MNNCQGSFKPSNDLPAKFHTSTQTEINAACYGRFFISTFLSLQLLNIYREGRKWSKVEYRVLRLTLKGLQISYMLIIDTLTLNVIKCIKFCENYIFVDAFSFLISRTDTYPIKIFSKSNKK